MSLEGQQPALPQRNIARRFASISRYLLPNMIPNSLPYQQAFHAWRIKKSAARCGANRSLVPAHEPRIVARRGAAIRVALNQQRGIGFSIEGDIVDGLLHHENRRGGSFFRMAMIVVSIGGQPAPYFKYVLGHAPRSSFQPCARAPRPRFSPCAPCEIDLTVKRPHNWISELDI
jgi:hypothetical protein